MFFSRPFDDGHPEDEEARSYAFGGGLLKANEKQGYLSYTQFFSSK
jgi:hypothetical protein